MVRAQLETVFIVEQQQARLRLVRTGKTATGKVDLLPGVSAGENVVIESAGQLRDGQPVTLKP